MGIDKPEDMGKRARRMIGLGLAGALAAGSPAHAQDDSRSYNADYTDPGYDDTYGNSGYDDFSNESSKEVIDLFKDLHEKIGDTLSITDGQNMQIMAAIDDFVMKHPERNATVTLQTDPDGSASGGGSSAYSPWAALEDALKAGVEKNPTISAASLKYVQENLPVSGAPAEQ